MHGTKLHGRQPPSKVLHISDLSRLRIFLKLRLYRHETPPWQSCPICGTKVRRRSCVKRRRAFLPTKKAEHGQPQSDEHEYVGAESSRRGNHSQRDSAIAEGTKALPGIGGQFAAAFRGFGQCGAIPTATEGLDERDCVDHAAAENIYRSEFVSESRALSGCHFQITGDAAFISCPREFQILLGRGDCLILNLSFALENPQCCYVVFDLLEAGQDGLTIVSDCLVEKSDGLV